MKEKDDMTKVPSYCLYGTEMPGYHCMSNSCKYSAYTYAPCEIAYANDKGEVDSCADSGWIGFGGDMESDELKENEVEERKLLWEAICKKKIVEAYEEYMVHVNSMAKD